MTPQAMLAALEGMDEPPAQTSVLGEVAHDMRQPIVTIQVLIDSFLVSADLPTEYRKQLQLIAAEADLLGALVNSLLEPGALPGTPVSVSGSVQSVLDTVRLAFPGRLVMTAGSGTERPLRIDPLSLRRSVANLVVNATRAAGPHGTVHVSVLDSPCEICVRVEDDGPGFGLIEHEHLLGLGIVRKCVRENGGELDVGRSATLGGARVELHFRHRDN